MNVVDAICIRCERDIRWPSGTARLCQRCQAGGDFAALDDGSIVLLRPLTSEARDWIEKYIGPDNGFQPYWPEMVVIEENYFPAILAGFESDGLTLKR